MVEFPATCVQRKSISNNPVVAMISFLPIEEVMSLTNHMSAPRVEVNKMAYVRAAMIIKENEKKKKEKLGVICNSVLFVVSGPDAPRDC
jgi:hypothetical protein